MERLTDKFWRNFDPWECCGQDKYCKRGLDEEGGCVNGCKVPKLYRKLAEYEDAEEQGLLITLPCKVGDTVWGIKVYKNFLVAKQGTVREMYFTQDMKLAIGLHGVCRGEYGKRIFRTQEETEQAIMDMGYVRSEKNPRFFKKGE